MSEQHVKFAVDETELQHTSSRSLRSRSSSSSSLHSRLRRVMIINTSSHNLEDLEDVMIDQQSTRKITTFTVCQHDYLSEASDEEVSRQSIEVAKGKGGILTRCNYTCKDYVDIISDVQSSNLVLFAGFQTAGSYQIDVSDCTALRSGGALSIQVALLSECLLHGIPVWIVDSDHFTSSEGITVFKSVSHAIKFLEQDEISLDPPIIHRESTTLSTYADFKRWCLL